MEPDAPARHLFDRDPTVTTFGIELVAADAHGATVRMTVRPEMCNGYGMIHGGLTFLLADSAMAFASSGEGETALATSAGIDWFAPATVDDVLTATARRCGGGKKSVVWDVEITNQHDEPIATFRGRTRKIGTPVISD
ncbi:MAG: hotdog fold thioesterase [Acidimicrobiia bacterium]